MVQQLCDPNEYREVVIAMIIGDDITYLVKRVSGQRQDRNFRHLEHEDNLLDNWSLDLKPGCAAAYIMAW